MVKSTGNQQIKNQTNWKQLFLELIVVFLGVTAGFLLNNWQLNKQDQKLEKRYLSSFLQDVTKNITDLKRMIQEDSLWLSSMRPNLVALTEKTISMDSADSVIKRIVKISKVEVQKGTYEAITNSGNLNIITSYNLKKQIVDYHTTISEVEFVDNYFYQYFNNFSVLEARLKNLTVIKNIHFKNVIAGYYSMVQQRKDAYEDLLKKSYILKIELEK